MKRTSLVLYLGILLASLALAYLTWVQGPKKADDGVPILRCKKGDIIKVAYVSKDRTVNFARKKSRYSGESSWWVETISLPTASASKKTEAAEQSDAGRKEAAPPEEPPEVSAPDETVLEQEGASETEPIVEVFKANKRAQNELHKLCPWKALRALGQVGKEKREEFGLTDAEESLIVEVASGVRTFRLGKTTYGPQDRYVEDEETGEVFLTAGQGIRNLLKPKSRFMERSLHSFKREEVARVRLRTGQTEKELVHKVSDQDRGLGWADSHSPQETKDLYRNWIRKLFSLRATDYVRPPEGSEHAGCVAPPGSSQELSVTFYSRKKEIGFLTVYEETDEKGGSVYYACTEHTEIVVKMPRTHAETLLKDMEDLFGE